MQSKETDPKFYELKADNLLSGEMLAKITEAVLVGKASFRFRACGYSMHPFIQDKDILTVVSLCRRALSFGRVAAFIHPKTGKLIVHRMIGERRGGYLFKGDNSFSADDMIPKEQILGCISHIERDQRAACFGLGAERLLIGLLSKIKILPGLNVVIGRLVPYPVRKTIKSFIGMG